MPVVEAVGLSIVNISGVSDEKMKQISDAGQAAIAQAQAEGVTDPDIIRARVIEAVTAAREG